MIQRFEVPGKLPSLNEYTCSCRTNPYAGASAKKEAQARVLTAINAARLFAAGFAETVQNGRGALPE